MQAVNHFTILDQMSLLADPLRARILLVLEQQELTVGELCSVLQLPQSTTSRHLRTLADGGWVASRPDGTRRLYHETLENLDPGVRGLWLLAREQVAESNSANQDARRIAGVLAERRSRSQEFFAGAAERWDRVRDELFGRSSYFLALLELLDREMTVADLGCGTGAVAEALATAVRTVIAIDGSDAMLEAARTRLATIKNVKLQRGDLEDVPLRDDSVDAATLILVLHHLSDPGKAVAEVARILRPGGKLLIVDMLPHDRVEYQQEMGHVWMGFSERKVRGTLARCGFGAARFHPLPPDPSARGPVLFAASATVTAREVAPARETAARRRSNEAQRPGGGVEPAKGRRSRK